jgi:DNA-directed RNA polymerase subunit RPC12/RpoP
MGTITASDTQVYKATCPECEWTFNIECPEQNEVVRCGDCNLSLVIKKVEEGVRKVQLELTETDADDWGQ